MTRRRQICGVTMKDISQTLQTYLGSSYVNLFNKFNQSFQVRVQSEADYRRQLEHIGNLTVANVGGQMVPLGSLLDVHRVLGADLLPRYNLYPAAILTGVPMPKFSSGEALSYMEQTADSTFPQGMSYEWTGLSYQEKLLGSQAYVIFALSITMVFLVLAAQYESWTDPAAVILTVPMALVGLVVAGDGHASESRARGRAHGAGDSGPDVLRERGGAGREVAGVALRDARIFARRPPFRRA